MALEDVFESTSLTYRCLGVVRNVNDFICNMKKKEISETIIEFFPHKTSVSIGSGMLERDLITNRYKIFLCGDNKKLEVERGVGRDPTNVYSNRRTREEIEKSDQEFAREKCQVYEQNMEDLGFRVTLDIPEMIGRSWS